MCKTWWPLPQSAGSPSGLDPHGFTKAPITVLWWSSDGWLGCNFLVVFAGIQGPSCAKRGGHCHNQRDRPLVWTPMASPRHQSQCCGGAVMVGWDVTFWSFLQASKDLRVQNVVATATISRIALRSGPPWLHQGTNHSVVVEQ